MINRLISMVKKYISLKEFLIVQMIDLFIFEVRNWPMEFLILYFKNQPITIVNFKSRINTADNFIIDGEF